MTELPMKLVVLSLVLAGCATATPTSTPIPTPVPPTATLYQYPTELAERATSTPDATLVEWDTRATAAFELHVTQLASATTSTPTPAVWSPLFSKWPTDEPTPTARPPAEKYFEWFTRQIRIENSWRCGGNIHDCVAKESEALIMTRVAMGEAPRSLNDRIYTMWNIKMRAELGFKNAGSYVGTTREIPGRWGPETTIAQEALCLPGCQFEVMRQAKHLYFGCDIPATAMYRGMFCPTDDQLGDFLATYEAAVLIVYADLTDMPRELWGYDGFRSVEISWNGRIDWKGGLPSRQFFRGGNVWRDEYPVDNLFWEEVNEETAYP